MNIIEDKNWIHQEIEKSTDISFIDKLKHLIEYSNSDKKCTVEEYNSEINDA